ncbi:MAG TPA: hypothetical protein PL084_09710, partial [Chitinophagales bacterium]|nr:hypothetical protein [Chitinophagales bacterium]
PKVCVYDAHSGWNTDQHLNREFYGNFGTFEVALTFASNYIVEATGVLLNESEMLPDSLKQKLQISNFKNKKWNETPSVIIPYKKGETKTWKYRAINVHDFAFTADPTYRIADLFCSQTEIKYNVLPLHKSHIAAVGKMRQAIALK